MKVVNYDKDIKELFVILICLVIMLVYFTFIKFTYRVDDKSNVDNNTVVEENNAISFNVNFIKNVNNVSGTDNYLVSPYSVEVALNMLKIGANGTTLSELNSVIGNRTINNFVIKNRIGIANSLFVKDIYKEYFNTEFYDNVKNIYNGDILYDKFESTDVINNWCKEKTWSMIDKVIDVIDDNFVLGLANAVAIDVEWSKQFDCSSTDSQEFTKVDNSKFNVEMMHNTYNDGAKYLELDNAKGIVIPYKKYDTNGNEIEDGNNLEFVGILPNGSISDLINGLNDNFFSNIDSNATVSNADKGIRVSLPKFSYSYSLDKFKDVLVSMGIKELFDSTNSNLTGIMSKENMNSLGINNLYIDSAIHKTYIDLNEKGTKASAVTMFNLNTSMATQESEYIDIEFNKPFIYFIRDNESKEILFFGTVYSPNEWKGNTCSNNE